MKIQLLMMSLLLSLGLTAQAGDLDLVFYTTTPDVEKTDCERVTKLTKKSLVGRNGQPLTYITLSDAIEGMCEIYVDPTPRVYVVQKEERVCGSTIYRANQEGTQETLMLGDHTTRTCEDIVPAPYVLMKAHPQKRYAPLYASESAPTGPDIPYHPGPVTEITDGNAVAQALILNPNIGEVLRQNNLYTVTKMTRQGIRPGVTRYVLKVSSAMRGALGSATVVIVEDRRPTYSDGAIKYEIDIQILE